MKVTKTPGSSPRQLNGPCFCTSLNRVVANLPAQERTVIQSAINAFLQSPGASDDSRSGWFYALAGELTEITACSPPREQFLKVLDTPVLADCESKVYAAVAYAVAKTLPWQEAAKVVDALRKNVAMCGDANKALYIVAQYAPKAVLGLLHDGLCADIAIAVKTQDVLRGIKPRISVIQKWLDSSVPGPRAAMLFYLANSGKSPKLLTPAVAKAMGDPDPNFRRLVVQAVFNGGCSFLDVKPVLLAALNDPDPVVRSGAGNELFDCPCWTEELLPELSGILLNDGYDDVRVLVAQRLGELRKDGTRAATALKTVAKEGNTKVGKAAREALALITPQKIDKAKVG